MKKYELTEDTKTYNGKTLHRIKATKSFGSITTRTLGGWIESEKNLSHDGDCWVGEEAIVCDDASVRTDAFVYGEAIVSERATINGDARIYGQAQVSGLSLISDNVHILGNARVSGQPLISGLVHIGGNVHVDGNAIIFDRVWIEDDACVSENAKLWGNVSLSGTAKVSGNATIGDSIRLAGSANIMSGDDVLYISSGGGLTFYNTADHSINVTYFLDNIPLCKTLSEFEMLIDDSNLGAEYKVAVELAKIKLMRK